MAEDRGKKGRVLFLAHYLYENTDEDHPVTRKEIRKAYEKNGFTVSKNTFTDDFRTLEEEGVILKKNAFAILGTINIESISPITIGASW